MADQKIDGVQLALLSNRLEGISSKMGNTLMRTGRSGVLNIARDFSCCILTADNDLAAVAESLPIHVLSGPDIMAQTMKDNHPELKRGDAFLHNSPYHGCSHAADHTILVPVIDDDGIHRYTVAAKAHQADIGNSIPTTYHGTARDVYEEGALIFPAVKVQEDYEYNMDIVRMCRLRIRVPDQWWGDFLAMMGAARIGERELLALGKEVGWDTLEAFNEQWFAYSEERMIGAIRQLPAGTATRTSTHDAIPGTPEDGIPINSTVTIKPDEAMVTVDLRDNMDAQPCGLNLSEACARTAAMVGVFNSIDHTVPKNAGSFRRIEVLLRENSVCGIPKHPTSCSVATTNIADRVSNPTQAAIAEIADGFGLAECGAIIPPAVGVVSGTNPDSGEPFVNQVFLGLTGGAGAPDADCWQSICHVGNGGLCYQDSIELDELRQPLYIKTRTFAPDTEGAGRFCGARSAYTEFGPRIGNLDVAYVSDGGINGPKGVRGGLDGSTAGQFKITRNGEHEELPNCDVVSLMAGEMIGSQSCGGGGYGSPLDRDPEMVAHDVREEYVSADRARSVYGVVVDGDGNLDASATEKLRAEMAA
ncbi:MAG: hydantoinase B/oxoprolinase family protein [Alphaproteobacteria bacterium]|nr:hydantoinase B/oxoprolinase family protein [Alphaproteobacteria bacterium]